MSAKKLSTVTCHVINAYDNTAKNVIHAYRAGGERVVKLADAGVHSVSANASRFEDKTGAHVLSNLAQAALPGAVALSALASQIEQKSAHLASRIAGDNVVVTVARRTRAAARKP